MDVMLITVITGVFCLVLLWYFFSWSVGKRYRSRPFSKATSSLCWSLHVTFLLGMAKTLISILLSVTESQSQCEAFGIIGSVTTAVMVFSVYVFAFFRFKTVMNLRRRLIVLQMESSFETPIQDFIEKKKFLFFAVMSICLIIVTIVTKGIIHHIDDRTFCFCLFPTYAIISNTVVYILFTILMVSLTIREILVTRWLLRSSSYKIYRNVVMRSVLSAGFSLLAFIISSVVFVMMSTKNALCLMTLQPILFIFFSFSLCLRSGFASNLGCVAIGIKQSKLMRQRFHTAIKNKSSGLRPRKRSIKPKQRLRLRTARAAARWVKVFPSAPWKASQPRCFKHLQVQIWKRPCSIFEPNQTRRFKCLQSQPLT